MRTLINKIAKAGLLLSSLLCSQLVQADYVNVDLNGSSGIDVFNTDSGQRLKVDVLGMQTNTYEVEISQSGLYSFDLWDIQTDSNYFERAGAFLTSNSELLTSVSLTTQAETRKSSEFLVEAGSYYLTLWGISDTPEAFFSLELSLIDSTQVPVPPAAILFGSGLMALFAYSRRKKQV